MNFLSICWLRCRSSWSGKALWSKGGRLRGLNGFTLIELLIVVAVLSLLSAVAIPGFNAYREACCVAAAVEEICGMIREAKQFALMDNRYSALGFNPALGTVTLIAARGADGTWNTSDDSTIRSLRLADKAGGVSFGYGGCGPLPGLAATTDGITFQTNNALVCNPELTGNAGTIYLISRGGSAMALTMNSKDFSYTMWRWSGKKWVKR